MVQCLFCDAGAFAIWLRTAMAAFMVGLFFPGAILHDSRTVLYTNYGKPRKNHGACAVRIMRLCVYIRCFDIADARMFNTIYFEVPIMAISLISLLVTLNNLYM